MQIFFTADGRKYSYQEFLWGDLILGDKEVLQRMGIAAGQPFPGEPGAEKKSVKTKDPRGFACRLELWGLGGFPYLASISHPGPTWSEVEDWRPYAAGVIYRPYYEHDEYLGSADALAAAGLVPSDLFPGMPGMSATQQTIYSDGTTPKTQGQKNRDLVGAVGSMVIKKNQ